MTDSSLGMASMWRMEVQYLPHKVSCLNGPSRNSTQTSDASSILKNFNSDDRNIKIAIFATAKSYNKQVSMKKPVLSKQATPFEAVKRCCKNKLNPCKSY